MSTTPQTDAYCADGNKDELHLINLARSLEHKLTIARAAIIGLLGQVEEYAEDIGECNHAIGLCRCRALARIEEAKEALTLSQHVAADKPKDNSEPKPNQERPPGTTSA